MSNGEAHIKTLVVFRHGYFEGTRRGALTGGAAVAAVAEGLRLADYDNMPLLPKGIEQAKQVRRALAEVDIDACLCSPTRRTVQMAGIVLKGKGLRTGIEQTNRLRERDRGIFSFMPDEWASQHSKYRVGKESTLNWRPEGGKTLREIMPRLEQALQRADQLAPGGCVAFCTHGEAMVALRAMSRLSGLTDAQFAQPLIPNPPAGTRALQKAKWVGQAQIDMWECRNLDSANMSHFRSIGVEPSFDTGWVAIKQ